MSAFLVSPRCINSVVTYINRHADIFNWSLKSHGYNASTDFDRLASDLFALNCEALDQRYGNGTALQDTEGEPQHVFRFVEAEPVAVYKAACCLHYQCSEGEVPQHPLYKALTAIRDTIAGQIISALPSYETASWGD